MPLPSPQIPKLAYIKCSFFEINALRKTYCSWGGDWVWRSLRRESGESESGFILVLTLPLGDKEKTGMWLQLKGCESKSFSIWVMPKESLILSPGLELLLGSCSESLYQKAHSAVSALVNNQWEEEPRVSRLLKCACAPPRLHRFLLRVKIGKAWNGPCQQTFRVHSALYYSTFSDWSRVLQGSKN